MYDVLDSTYNIMPHSHGHHRGALKSCYSSGRKTLQILSWRDSNPQITLSHKPWLDQEDGPCPEAHWSFEVPLWLTHMGIHPHLYLLSLLLPLLSLLESAPKMRARSLEPEVKESGMGTGLELALSSHGLSSVLTPTIRCTQQYGDSGI